jgi:holliday junction DNA helicase RuvB
MTRRDVIAANASLTSTEPIISERSHELTLRPQFLSDFVGQSELVNHLRVVLGSAKARRHTVDHILFAGPPGLGKTSLAAIVANEMGVQCKVTAGPILNRPGDLAAIVTDLAEGDVLFIDEIHRLPATVEEILYPAMEDRRLDVLIGKGPSARSIRLELPFFTLVGATTRTGLVSSPLRDRFGFVGQLDLYNTEELTQVVMRAATILDVSLNSEAASVIASRSRGTPRIANRLLRRVRDFAAVEGHADVNGQMAEAALTLFGIDPLGLDKVDRRILGLLCDQFGGNPVGLSTLAHACAEDTQTIEDAYEPFLLREGLIIRTPRGRVATEKAYVHLGRQIPGGGLV